MMNMKTLTVNVGDIFTCWKVLAPPYVKETENKESRRATFVQVQCECGNIKDVNLSCLIHGRSKSCGCKKTPPTKYTHGLSDTPLYHLWANIKSSCLNPNTPTYQYYGGKGVKVCDKWLTFETFFDWARVDFKLGLTLDRINRDGDYSPDNCRWATMKVQTQNRKCKRGSSGFIGVTKHKKKWVARAGLNYKNHYLGAYDTKEEAARARDKFVIEHYDSSAPTNFPRSEYES